MKIAISAESTIDMPKELLDQFDIHTVPFTILLGDNARLDGEIKPQEIFDYVYETKVLPKTSAVNEFQFEEHFKKLLENYDAIIHFSISKTMSSAYDNACRVAKELKNVYVVDSMSLSTGIALQAIYAKKLADKDYNVEEIVEKVKKRIPYDQASFILSRLDYLYKGGRCSALALIGANILRLRPQIIVKNGKMEPHKKFRGNYSTNVIKYVDATLEEFNNPDKENIFITYSSASKETVDEVHKILEEKGFKNIYVTTAGGTVSSHCGEHCLGILYFNDGEQND